MQVEDFDIRKIADSGQAFRIVEESPGIWRAVAAGRVLHIDEAAPCIPEGFWSDYFDLETDYSFYRVAIPEQDEFLTKASQAGKGIRILRQDPWEMLITFILSQRKNIPAIRSGVEALCELCGSEIKGEGIKAFPTPEQLCSASEEELRRCSLGYRTPYIMKSARMAAEGVVDLEACRELPDDELFEQLLRFPGVGPKVANCVSLFGYHRIAAFPVDVWIERIIKQEYGGDFPFHLYEGFGGVIQQYMFYYGRYPDK